MKEELARGWVVCTVRDVIESAQAGFASGEKNVDLGIAHLRMNNIGVNGELVLDLIRHVPARLRKEQYELRSGDVLICTTNSGKLVGKSTYFDLDGLYCFSNHITRLRPNRSVVNGQLLQLSLWLSWKLGAFDEKCKNWVNQSSLPKEDLLDTTILLAPMNEQLRIVAQLNASIGKVTDSQARLARFPAFIGRFRQSVLEAACSGRLTADWREEHGVDLSSWHTKTIGSICEIIGGSQPPKKHFVYKEQKGYIRFIQIRDYKSDNNLTYIPKEMARRYCSKTDVMIGRYGPPLFQILRGIEGTYNVALMKAVPISDRVLSNDFLFIILQYPPLRNYIISSSERTVGQDGVRKDLLEEYEVNLPLIDEQEEIVRRVNKLFALADKIETRYKSVKQQIDRLPQSILAKAFRGELVPTDAELAEREGRSYESAEQLLQRVRAAKEGDESDDNSKTARKHRAV